MRKCEKCGRTEEELDYVGCFNYSGLNKDICVECSRGTFWRLKAANVGCKVCESTNIVWERPSIRLGTEHHWEPIKPWVTAETDFSNLYFSSIHLRYDGVCECGEKAKASFTSRFGNHTFHRFY